MAFSLALTGLLMGLAGGPHCAAMCAAACGAIVRGDTHAMLRFQAGRLIGYTALGAAAGAAVENLVVLSTHTAALRPLRTLFYLVVLAWALMLVARARQPAWVEAAGRSLWLRVQPFARARGGLLAIGALWAFMPCGLLYSALLVASLAGGAIAGGATMAAFAFGSGVALAFAPALLRRVQGWGNRLRAGGGTRAAGALLALAASWSLGSDLGQRIAQWCAA